MKEVDRTDPTNRWWRQPLLALLIASALILSWVFALLNPNKNPPTFWVALMLAIAGGIFFTYLWPWLLAKLPPHVTIYEKCIVRTGAGNRQIILGDLESFAWQTTPEFSILVLTHHQGRQILIGVPLEFSKEQILTFFSTRLGRHARKA